MTGAMLFTMLLCFALTVSVAVSIGLAAIVGIQVSNVNMLISVKEMFASINKFPLAAIPFFILAGNLMETGGISRRLVEFAKSLVGGVQGGLPMTCVMTCMIFAAVSGSSVATTFAIGAILIPALIRHGYPTNYAAALQATSAELGVIIPPSIPMILYAVIANVSVGALFAAGILPGLLVAAALMLGVAYQARRRNLPRGERVAPADIPRLLWRGVLPLGLPVVILGGIRVGAFTPTEGAAVAALYALFLVFVVYREMRMAEVYEVFRVSLVQSASVMTIIMGAFLVNYAVAADQLGQSIALWLTGMELGRTGFLVAVMVLFLILGCFIDTAIMLLVLVPMLLPTARLLGVDLVHFGLVVTVNMMIGMMTPPYGVLLFVVSGVTGIPVREVIREAWFFCAVLIACLIVLVAFPEISLVLPRSMGLVK
jgi:tripartite ATP-independent transporter DctM subunit